MLLELLSKLFRPNSSQTSAQKYSESSESSASSPPLSLVSSSKVSWINKATDQIKKDEGLVLHVYDDSLGYSTIGYGRLVDRRKGGGISQDEATFLLNNDVQSKLYALEKTIPWITGLDDARKGVLLNMTFQMGISGLLKFKNTLAKIEMGDYENASANMLKSLWARQTPNRANRLAEQMRTGQWQYG